LSHSHFILEEPENDPQMALANRVSIEGIDMGEELIYNSTFG